LGAAAPVLFLRVAVFFARRDFGGGGFFFRERVVVRAFSAWPVIS
jgi:hypothetical protein